MDEAKNVAEDFAVAGLMLETHDFRIDALEILVGLGEELPQQVVHTTRLANARFRSPALGSRRRRHARRRVWPPGGTPDGRRGVCWERV
jgi:hypothetical protein